MDVLQTILSDASEQITGQTRIIRKLIEKIEIFPDRLKIYYRAGGETLMKVDWDDDLKDGKLEPFVELREPVTELFFGSSRSLTNGGRFSNPEELLTVLLDYEMRWMKVKIDLRELAKLRRSGLSHREIAEVFGVGRTQITKRLHQLSL